MTATPIERARELAAEIARNAIVMKAAFPDDPHDTPAQYLAGELDEGDFISELLAFASTNAGEAEEAAKIVAFKPVVSFDVRAPYYLASCDRCGWVGSSEVCGLDRGGDDSDVYCPRCHASGADCGKVAERLAALAAKPLSAGEGEDADISDVTQADKDALQAAWDEYASWMGDPDGKDDSAHAFNQAAKVIARHRLATSPAIEREGVSREGVCREKIADIIDPEAVLPHWREFNKSLWIDRRNTALGKADKVLAALSPTPTIERETCKRCLDTGYSLETEQPCSCAMGAETIAREAYERAAWPRLTDAMINAAADAHFGKKRSALVGGPDGISMTVDSTDWTFRQAMRRMWPALKRAALSPGGDDREDGK